MGRSSGGSLRLSVRSSRRIPPGVASVECTERFIGVQDDAPRRIAQLVEQTLARQEPGKHLKSVALRLKKANGAQGAIAEHA